MSNKSKSKSKSKSKFKSKSSRKAYIPSSMQQPFDSTQFLASLDPIRYAIDYAPRPLLPF